MIIYYSFCKLSKNLTAYLIPFSENCDINVLC